MNPSTPTDRRSFLRAVAILAGSAVGLTDGPLTRAASLSYRSLGAGHAQDASMQLTLNPGRIGLSIGQMEAIELADRFGFDAVAPQADHLADLSEEGLAELRAELRTRNLVFSAASLQVEYDDDRETFRRDLLELPAFAEALARAGVHRVGTFIWPTHAERTYQENFELHVRRLQPIARILQNHGLRLGLEYVATPHLYESERYPFVHDMAETLDLIAEIGYQNVGLILDSWHWYMAQDGRDAILGLSPEDVVAVDLNDAPPGLSRDEQNDTTRRLPTTTGVIDLEAFLSALAEIGYAGPLRAEPFDDSLAEMGPEKAVARTAETMKAAMALVAP